MVEGSIMSRPDKIDTQGMTAAGIEKSSMLKTTHYPNGYPSFKPLTTPKMIDGMLRDELKELINEVLDEREARRYSNVSIGSTLNGDL